MRSSASHGFSRVLRGRISSQVPVRLATEAARRGLRRASHSLTDWQTRCARTRFTTCCVLLREAALVNCHSSFRLAERAIRHAERSEKEVERLARPAINRW